jgi:hypothetical protein
VIRYCDRNKGRDDDWDGERAVEAKKRRGGPLAWWTA